MRWLSTLLVLIPALLPAQTIELRRPARTTVEQLRSPRAATVARTAARIADRGFHRHRKELIAALQTWGSGNDYEAELVRLHLLDALVQTGARLPGPDVLPHVRGIAEVPAFVLLARDPQQNEPELMQLFLRPRPPSGNRSIVWWGAGNLLAAQKTPGFAAALLAKSAFGLVVRVQTFGWLPDARGFGGCGYCAVASHRHDHEPGFPALPAYSFVLSEIKPGDNCLAPGVSPVGWRRKGRVQRGKIWRLGGSEHNGAYWRRREWIATLAGRERLALSSPLNIEFTTAARFTEAVTAARKAAHTAHRQLVADLMQHGGLTKEEASLHEFVTRVYIDDQRKDKSVPLPTIEPASDQ